MSTSSIAIARPTGSGEIHVDLSEKGDRARDRRRGRLVEPAEILAAQAADARDCRRRGRRRDPGRPPPSAPASLCQSSAASPSMARA